MDIKMSRDGMLLIFEDIAPVFTKSHSQSAYCSTNVNLATRANDDINNILGPTIDELFNLKEGSIGDLEPLKPIPHKHACGAVGYPTFKVPHLTKETRKSLLACGSLRSCKG